MNYLIAKIRQLFQEEKQEIYEAIGRNYKENNIEIKYSKLEDIINKLVNQESKKVDSTKTVLNIYNGNTYLMLEIVLKNLICGNNTLLISERENTLNSVILNVIRNALKQENSPLVIKEYAQVNLENALKETKLIHRVVFFGDKRQYRQLKNSTNIETKYNGYGSIIVYVEDEDEFEEELEEIDEFAYLNNFYINKITEDLEEEINNINKDGKNDVCIILSRDEEKIKLFKEKVYSNNIFVNEINYEMEHEILQELFEF